jgi:hypothetical protein
MEPINTSNKDTQACIPISSNCIVWQGPDIPCINLCSGDSITEVVYKLATKLCEMADQVIDLSALDLTCLNPSYEPTTQTELIELLISKICEALGCCNNDGGIIPGVNYYNLPPCLQYTENDQVITQLPLPDYLIYLATQICDVITSINDLTTRVTSLEIAVAALQDVTYPTADIYITTQCASGGTPGVTMQIQTAFENFESKFCQLLGLLGSTTAIDTFIDVECSGIDTAPQLADPAHLMNELTGWTSSPSNVMQNLTNLWLVVCDMRSKVNTCCNVDIPCSTVPVSNISNIVDGVNVTFNWTAPALIVGAPTPTSLLLEIFRYTSGSVVTPSVYNQTFGGTAVTSGSINVSGFASSYDELFYVKITAIYTCGEAEAFNILHLVSPSVAPCVRVTDNVLTSSTSIVCGGSNYPATQRSIYVELRDAGNNLIVNTATAITVRVMFTLAYSGGSSSTEYVDVVLPAGVSNVAYNYYSAGTQMHSGTCTDFTRTYIGVNSASSTLGGRAFCSGTTYYTP